MKTMKGHKSGQSGFKGFSVYLQPGDQETLDRFFQQYRRIKKGDFYRDAIIREIRRYQKKKASEGVEEAL